MRTQLHTNENVYFAGYKPDHPTVHNFYLKIQTRSGYTPASAVSTSLGELLYQVGRFETDFESALQDFEEEASNGDVVMNEESSTDIERGM